MNSSLPGLKRLVRHASAQLAATRTTHPTGARETDDRAKAWAASALAEQVLDLVADCIDIPEDDDDA